LSDDLRDLAAGESFAKTVRELVELIVIVLFYRTFSELNEDFGGPGLSFEYADARLGKLRDLVQEIRV
jgi:hypothetical protein